jgi:DNA-binding transcriptional ArsR family regulator
MSDQNHSFVNAVRHELRRRILKTHLGLDTPYSPRECSILLREALSSVSYHYRVLADCGALKLVKERRVRGSVQHFYEVEQRFRETPWVLQILELDES